MPQQTAVVVLAAGAGTRMRSKTPKVLHSLAGRSMLAHALHAANEIDPAYLITVVGHDREQVGGAAPAAAAAPPRAKNPAGVPLRVSVIRCSHPGRPG